MNSAEKKRLFEIEESLRIPITALGHVKEAMSDAKLSLDAARAPGVTNDFEVFKYALYGKFVENVLKMFDDEQAKAARQDRGSDRKAKERRIAHLERALAELSNQGKQLCVDLANAVERNANYEEQIRTLEKQALLYGSDTSRQDKDRYERSVDTIHKLTRMLDNARAENARDDY